MTDAPAKAGERPVRIRLSRAKGWRMPENTVKVDRATKWGNPFVVGEDGTAAECVGLFRALVVGGWLCMSCKAVPSEQKGALYHARANIDALRGKNLACWCALDKPCHADVLLEIANAPLPAARDAAMKEGG
jgi:hypothetical protein